MSTMQTDRPKPGERPLTLTEVSDSMLAEYGFRRDEPPADSYLCSYPKAVMLPLTDIVGPEKRMLNEDAVRFFLRSIRAGDHLDAICVLRKPGAQKAKLKDGTHRWRVSLALGFPMIPCRYVNLADAESIGWT